MTRYIDADKLHYSRVQIVHSDGTIGGHQAVVMSAEIKDAPTADVVEVKHGYWKRNERNIPKMREFHEKGIASSMDKKSIFYSCSCCNSWGSLSQNYCFECGAKMDGK